MTQIDKLIEGVRELKERLDRNFDDPSQNAALTWTDVRELMPKILPYLPPPPSEE